MNIELPFPAKALCTMPLGLNHDPAQLAAGLIGMALGIFLLGVATGILFWGRR